MYIIPLRFVTTENGCFIPLSHKLNADGYFRKGWPWGLEMFHRTIWRLHYGAIPAGYEIDHICLIRSCCNIKHLQCLPGSVHTAKGNALRYLARKREAHSYWLSQQCTGGALSKKFGVSWSAGCRWIREWCGLTVPHKEPSHA